MAQRIIERVTGVITTTNATATLIASIPIPNGAAARAEARAVGRNTSTGSGATATLVGVISVVAGALSILGTVPGLNVVPLAMTGVTVTLTNTGTTLEMRVQGLAATSIEWFGELEVMID